MILTHLYSEEDEFLGAIETPYALVGGKVKRDKLKVGKIYTETAEKRNHPPIKMKFLVLLSTRKEIAKEVGLAVARIRVIKLI